ncbi:hypothetical protein DXG01_006610 [Tephrocybe rancida]|nr:hypothetical protein DXG01_006610 [Tephrocybe rancida]
MSTMLESFDTQMLDFQADPDYSMSSDPWFQDEAIMEDDGHTPLQTTIEVDMEPYDEQGHPEYEMEDDSENVEPDSNDIPDVEVYDASRFQSPDAFDAHEVPTLSVDPPEPLPIATEYIESSHPAPTLSEAQNSDEIASDVLYRHLPSSHLPDPLTEITTSSTEQPTEASHHPIDHDGANVPATNDSHDSPSIVAKEPLLDGQTNGNEHKEDVAVISENALHTGPSTDHRDDEIEHPAEEYAEPLEYEGSNSDPHEISEGVYIDPPPPVLVSLSTEAPSISLFNSPSKSRLNSPHTKESDAPELVVLLSQLPTLYYEPLSSVFQALRQEEYLGDVPDLLHGELLLDAYDLELTMSEDYTYAHELSLHDLNVLHDGLNKPGPLRLRLRAVTPRFIERYHLLQDQIAQLQLAEPTADPEEPSTAVVSESEASLETETFFETSGAELATEDISSTEPLEPEVHRHEGIRYFYRTLSEGTPSLSNDQGDNHKPEQEETAADPYQHEEETVQEESITPVAGADNANKRNSPEAEAEDDHRNFHDDNGHQHDEDQHDGGRDPHADDSHQEDDFEFTPSGEAGEEPVVHAQMSNAAVSALEKSELAEFLAYVVEADYGWFEDVENIDTANLDSVGLQETSEGLDSVVPGAAVERELTNLAQELDQADSLVDADIVNDAQDSEVADPSHLPDDHWDDTLDGEGEWEEEEHELGQEHEYAPEYEQELEHEHETASNLSSVTLSSKSSIKRSLSEAELEEYEDEELSPSSPDPKRPRVD